MSVSSADRWACRRTSADRWRSRTAWRCSPSPRSATASPACTERRSARCSSASCSSRWARSSPWRAARAASHGSSERGEARRRVGRRRPRAPSRRRQRPPHRLHARRAAAHLLREPHQPPRLCHRLGRAAEAPAVSDASRRRARLLGNGREALPRAQRLQRRPRRPRAHRRRHAESARRPPRRPRRAPLAHHFPRGDEGRRDEARRIQERLVPARQGAARRRARAGLHRQLEPRVAEGRVRARADARLGQLRCADARRRRRGEGGLPRPRAQRNSGAAAMVMNFLHDRQTLWLFGGVLGLLLVATIVGQTLRWRIGPNDVVANLNARIRAWWIMSAVFAFSLATGGLGSVILFAILSFFALREFVTLTPTRPADHSALFWVFFIITPLQYYLVATQWYGFFAILIPVYAFLFIPSRIAIAGDAAALLMLNIPHFEGKNARLLFFLVVVVQLSDVLQYVWGKLLGRHKIAPVISPSKTWEGFVGGVLTATAIGGALCGAPPFKLWQATAMAFVITMMGFAGGLTMSAIKRDRGVKDWGAAIEGHGGVLDRIDSICFAAPVFFHLTRYFFTP